MSDAVRDPIKVSFIIPSCNEADDIADTLETVLRIRHPDKEILVVDDSTDNTPDIVRRYESAGVRLIRRPIASNGCCGARNLGMREATGELLVLLNADVKPEVDFLERLIRHYKAGADYVLVGARVMNTHCFLARYVDALHCLLYGPGSDLLWTEGFSCRRSAALAVGLIPGDYPVRVCRDWRLGQRLDRAGYRKVVDREIVVSHVAPAEFGLFWRTRRTRGLFTGLSKSFIEGRSLVRILTETSIKTSRTILSIGLVGPILFRAFRLARCSSRGLSDWLPFAVAWPIDAIAFNVGEWTALGKLIRISFSPEIRSFGKETAGMEATGTQNTSARATTAFKEDD